MSQDSLRCLKTLRVQDTDYLYYSLPAAEATELEGIARLPFSLKVLLENLLRHEDGDTVQRADLTAMAQWLKQRRIQHEIAYRPARVLMQDFTGVPAVVDLAAMRAAMVQLGGDPTRINPLLPVDLVIDHSVQVDTFGSGNAYLLNVKREVERNRERYSFLRWGQQAFSNFRVVPPGTGICHQVNLEHLAQGVWTRDMDQGTLAYPDTLVGTDSHTTMVNGLGVLGWGVGGIEAEAAMLGQPISMLIPEVVGFKLMGQLKEGITATDLVLTITQMLRAQGVVGKFVEFYGPGLDELPLPDRATIANMAPEYGATCGFFPMDEETLRYMQLTGRDDAVVARVRAYTQAQGLWRDAQTPDPEFTHTLELDLSQVVPSLAGPKRPQDRVDLNGLKSSMDDTLAAAQADANKQVDSEDFTLSQGDIVIAAITSCTNTSNPSVLMAAGLVAKKAVEKGLTRRPWVKTSLAPGSKVVTDYLEKAGLQSYLDQLGFQLVGYGCTTCIGNSGPLPEPVAQAIQSGDLLVSAVLSGNRNFEGRVHPQVKANWLASPPLVVAFALAGTTRIDLTQDPIGEDDQGNAVYLRDIWPSNQEVAQAVAQVDQAMFKKQYAQVFEGDADWQALPVAAGDTYQWDAQSTYVQHPPFFEGITATPVAITDIQGAGILAILGDSITTDHISPAGNIQPQSPAGTYLKQQGVDALDFNSYGARRGNHEVMMRGTFANIRIRNEMVPGTEGGITKHFPSGETLPIYDAAMRYQDEGKPLVVFAGKEYGTGSSRDWAAKGSRLLGLRAVIAESFERIHRSNLIGMGVLPLVFKDGANRQSLKLQGDETIDIQGLSAGIQPGMDVTAIIHRPQGDSTTLTLRCRIDTANEVAYYQNGGILHTVLRQLSRGA